MKDDEQYMFRCLYLAQKGAGSVAPNPMVGAVLVHENRILGEGWHHQYGGPHAEVNCIRQAIQNGYGHLIEKSSLYVSLEPCAHYGKTPPCTELIIRHKIPRVLIGCQDPFQEVNGKGIEQLKKAGVEVVTGILEEKCKELNKRFFTYHLRRRPYVMLKWAQTKDGFMAHSSSEKNNSGPAHKNITTGLATTKDWKNQQLPLEDRKAGPRLLISNDYSNRLVHQWRSEEAAILVGTNTALLDDPELTTRFWPGASPVRLVVDMNLRLPQTLKLLDGSVKTIVFNGIKHEEKNNLLFFKIDKQKPFIPEMLNALYELKLQSIMVEGGAGLLQSFIKDGAWDEARVIVNNELTIGHGLAAPVLSSAIKIEEKKLLNDAIQIFFPTN